MDTGVDKQSLDKDLKSLDKSVEVIPSNWKFYYLNSNQVDLSAMLRLKQEDFNLGNIKFTYYTASSKHIIFLLFSRYFAKELKVQKN